MGRVLLIVMDGCGVGAMPDAAEYGADDPASNTLAHVLESTGIRLPTLDSLGLSLLLKRSAQAGVGVIGASGKCAEQSKGKDSVTGHWEMMGVVTETAFPTYPNGFPRDVIAQFEGRIGREVLGNRAASGTQILAELGAEHVRTGKPIVYTSADSVFQVAAHEKVVTVDALYGFCAVAREMLVAPNNVQRVIARPFLGDESRGYTRTERRKDFPLPIPEPNILHALAAAGRRSHGIGVVVELFPARYFSVVERTQSNREHLAAIHRALDLRSADLIFANCEDFDMLYGHRNDTTGFGTALAEFDQQLAQILDKLAPDDLLIVTADHGNDPTTPSTDHSREFVPLLLAGKGVVPGSQPGVRASFADVGATVASALQVDWTGLGSTLLS